MNIRLIREVSATGPNGPAAGMYALQTALRARAPDWLRIGGELEPGELPWYWCWLDAGKACERAAAGEPFVMGPNIFFHSAHQPGSTVEERILLSAKSCRMIFTESAWYEALIRQHLRADVPIGLWPYPVLTPEWETDPRDRRGILVLAKSGMAVRDLAGLARAMRQIDARVRLMVYGFFTREELLAAACSSHVCLYLSESDRGPLALAEILQCGCPAVGTPQGAPWIEPGRNGYFVSRFAGDELLAAAVQCFTLKPYAIAHAARDRFAPERIAAEVLKLLDGARS